MFYKYGQYHNVFSVGRWKELLGWRNLISKPLKKAQSPTDCFANRLFNGLPVTPFEKLNDETACWEHILKVFLVILNLFCSYQA